MRFETVLFDLDGTLVDSAALILASFRHATRQVLGRVIPDEQLLANVGGGSIEKQMRVFDPERTDELVRVYREHNDLLYRRVETFAGIEPVLGRLQAEGRRLGIVTAKSRQTVEVTLAVLPSLGRCFGTIVTAEDTERHKPDPDGLLLALARLGAGAASAAYVGDAPFDIRAARAAGMIAIAVAWGKIHPLARLEAEGPDVIVREPRELVDVL